MTMAGPGLSPTLLTIELSLIEGEWTDPTDSSGTKNADLIKLARQVVKAEFKQVLTSQLSTSLLKLCVSTSDDMSGSSIDDWFSFEGLGDLNDAENELLRLLVGVACLHAFIQMNWTGPDLDIVPADFILTSNNGIPRQVTSEDFLHEKAISELAYGGEPAYHLARCAAFLRLAQILFGLQYKTVSSIAWWRLRAARVHEHLLDEPVPLPSEVEGGLEPLYAVLGSASSERERDLAGRLALEHGLLVAHMLGQDRRAGELFVRAARATGLEYELTGALGKRTKFQQTEITQLVLLAESRARDRDAKPSSSLSKLTDEKGETSLVDKIQEMDIEDKMSKPSIPETLALNDDTLLEKTEFTSSSAGALGSKLAHIDPNAQPPLHPLDQSILLSLCLNVKNTSPAHGLTSEQMAPYVARVLAHAQNWSVHTMALLLRSRLESSRTRTVERATLQLQALVDQAALSAVHPSDNNNNNKDKNNDDTQHNAPADVRLRFVHALPLPSRWELERELALRLLDLGAVRSALQIFERLEMWEEAARCWMALEQPETGIAIVRDLLEGRKSEAEAVILRGKAATVEDEGRRRRLDSAREAKLWCLLGDLEPSNALHHYERAWQVSSERSGRAMRSLGGYYFMCGEFERAIDCLGKAVAINPLQSRPWFILGCACVREERWIEARDAFARCVSIDDEDAESWNNLASIYLRMYEPPPTLKKTAYNDTEINGDNTVKQQDVISIPFENKLLAFRALKNGVKHAYDNWRMWTNYMIVAIDVGEFSEAARAQERIVEERSCKTGAEAVDEDVLDRLVDVVTRSQSDHTGPKSEGVEVVIVKESAAGPEAKINLLHRILDLFERVILPRVSSWRIHRAYARLLTSQQRWSNALKHYMEAFRLSPAATMEKGAAISRSEWLAAVQEVEDIVDVLHNFGPRAEDEARETGTDGEAGGESVPGSTGKWTMQGRSIVRTFMARTRDAFEDDPDWSRLQQLQQGLKR